MDSNDFARSDRRVYVSNINFECTIQDLRDKFSEVGEVAFARMVKNDNDRFSGCAIITYKDKKSVIKALELLNRHEFQGRKLVVKEREGTERKSDKWSNDFNSTDKNLPSLVVDQNTYGLSIEFLRSLKIDLPLLSTVFVANLDYEVSDKMLKEVFILAGNVINCEIFKDKEGKSRGFGIVEYEHPVEAVQAISMLHNQSYRDRVLAVRLDRSEKRAENKLRLPSGLSSVGMGLGADGSALKDMRSLSASRVPAPVNESLGLMSQSQLNPFGGNLMDQMGGRLSGNQVTGLNMRDRGMPDMPSRNFNSFGGSDSLGNILRVTNLPMDYTSENLQKLIWNCGDVLLAEMRSKGSGIVKLRTERDGQRALQMLDGQLLEGRMLSAMLL